MPFDSQAHEKNIILDTNAKGKFVGGFGHVKCTVYNTLVDGAFCIHDLASLKVISKY